jgi:PTS system fructose-specific IIC component
MSALITAEHVRLDPDVPAREDEVIRMLAGALGEAGRATDVEAVIAGALEREATSATGLPGGIAIPHCRTEGVTGPAVAFARLAQPADFGAKDGPADLVFLITAPADSDAAHLQVLARVARALVREDFVRQLRAAATPADAARLISGAVGEEPAPAAPAPAATAPGTGPENHRLVAVTACPTGIAHTYMAAEALEAAAERAGVDLAVETQGAAGAVPLPASTIRNAEAVIFAVDVGVRDRARFAGKPVIVSGVSRPIDQAAQMIAEALAAAADPRAPRVEGAPDGGEPAGATELHESWGGRTRRVLMTGVSYMIPFVAAGGLLIALGFLFGGYEIALNDAYGQILVHYSLFHLPDPAALGLHHALGGSPLAAYVGALLYVLGESSFLFFIPALAGYIAFAIADRPGIAPGFVMGGLAGNVLDVVDGKGLSVPVTGYLGAIAGGVLAGVIALWISRWKVPSWARGLMPVMIIPLITTVIAGLIMLLVLGKPIAWIMTELNGGLNSLSGGSAIILGVILGLMMAFDMGGPLNKVAYSFAVAGIASAGLSGDAPQLRIMAAVMLAGMVPPIALALATVVRPGLFTRAERENGKAGWLLGASFITEGAIPFAAADPLRVIPAIMFGSAVTGGVSEALNVAVRAPHGGIFVIFAVHNILGYLIALAAGIVAGALAVIVVKSAGRKPAAGNASGAAPGTAIENAPSTADATAAAVTR